MRSSSRSTLRRALSAAFVSGTTRDRADRSQDDRRMGHLPLKGGPRYKQKDIVPGARTVRWGGAGRWVSFFAVGTHRLFRLVHFRDGWQPADGSPVRTEH